MLFNKDLNCYLKPTEKSGKPGKKSQSPAVIRKAVRSCHSSSAFVLLLTDATSRDSRSPIIDIVGATLIFLSFSERFVASITVRGREDDGAVHVL